MGILFLCVANSARSQLAEGLARAMAPDGIEVMSAGSEPTSVRADAIEVMREIGVDISVHQAKHVDDIPHERVTTVITLCAEEYCPVYLQEAARLHWPIPDPAGRGLDAFRSARDEIATRLEAYFSSF
jgi:arsenate reductase